MRRRRGNAAFVLRLRLEVKCNPSSLHRSQQMLCRFRTLSLASRMTVRSNEGCILAMFRAACTEVPDARTRMTRSTRPQIERRLRPYSHGLMRAASSSSTRHSAASHIVPIQSPSISKRVLCYLHAIARHSNWCKIMSVFHIKILRSKTIIKCFSSES